MINMKWKNTPETKELKAWLKKEHFKLDYFCIEDVEEKIKELERGK